MKPSLIRRVTRREALKLLGLGAAGSLAAGARGPLGSPVSGETREPDAVVVGAGFAGLSAARLLRRAGKKVVLLDARDRVGGRVKAGRIAGQGIDLGGMWVGRRHTRLLALLAEYGIPRIPQYLSGRCITEIQGKRYVGPGETASLGSQNDRELRRVWTRLNALVEEVPVESPWTATRAEDWDRMTLDEWIRTETRNDVVRRMMRLVSRGLFAVEPHEMSLLFFLFGVRSGDGLDEVWGMEQGAQAFHVPGGIHRLAARMAEELGNRVVREAPVTAVTQDAAGATVIASVGSWRAERVIIAIPLPLSARIHYDPALPARRDALAQRAPMASVVKYWIAYKEPFWRRRGWNALVETDAPPTDEFVDASPPSGEVGLIAGFIDSRLALEWMAQPAGQRKMRIAERIAHYLGPEGAEPIDYVDADWPSDPWTRGCYGATMGPGVLTTLGPDLRRPFGRIHWAGAETSSAWFGYIEGAIRSGERAAGELLAEPHGGRS
jgi:monoamine oxidase